MVTLRGVLAVFVLRGGRLKLFTVVLGFSRIFSLSRNFCQFCEFFLYFFLFESQNLDLNFLALEFDHELLQGQLGLVATLQLALPLQ